MNLNQIVVSICLWCTILKNKDTHPAFVGCGELAPLEMWTGPAILGGSVKSNNSVSPLCKDPTGRRREKSQLKERHGFCTLEFVFWINFTRTLRTTYSYKNVFRSPLFLLDFKVLTNSPERQRDCLAFLRDFSGINNSSDWHRAWLGCPQNDFSKTSKQRKKINTTKQLCLEYPPRFWKLFLCKKKLY